jgi:murein L,D-transpeptidase YcbB/YkuD
VVLFYTTALARLDGKVEFAEDIYGHDTRLLQAMR